MADALTKKALNRLGVFTTFLGTATGRTGFRGGAITECGIPQARADSSPPAAYVADVPLWQELYHAWYTAADDAGLWVVPWASGPQWGDYNLAMHANDSPYTATGLNLDKLFSPGGLDVVEGHPTQDGQTYRRGVNLAGAEFGHKQPGFDNAHPGTFGTDYYFPTAADIAAVAARRITTVRLPISWERLQPTLLGALDATYLGRITAVADACQANGIGLILDLHNYARYEYSDGGTKKVLVLRYETGIDLANPGPTGEDAGKLGRDYLIDVWRRLSNAYRTHAGVVAYELMNEPHDVAPSSGSFSGTTLNSWNDGTVQSWASGGGGVTLAHTTTSPYEGSGSLRLSGTTGSAGVFYNMRAERGSVAGTGNVLRGRVRLNGTPTGTWQARFEWQNASFAWQAGATTTLTPGAWTEVVCDFAGNPIAGTALNLCLQVQCNSPAGSQAVTADLDLFERGSLTGTYTAPEAWEQITQAVLTDLRTRPDDASTRDTKLVLVPGHGWNVLGWDHADAWLTEPSGLEGTHRYVTHHYFDSTSTGGGEGEGVYQTADKRYADAKTYALSQGFTDDADATAPTISALSTGTPTATGATITWTTGEAADRRVEYGPTNVLSPPVYGRSTVRETNLLASHTVALSGLAPGTTYLIRITSRDAAGNRSTATASLTTASGPVAYGADQTFTTAGSTVAYGADQTFTTLPAAVTVPPAAPTGLTVVLSGAGGTTASLAWTDAATTESGYAVERSTNGTTFVQIADLPANTVTYSDPGRSPNTTYWYRVRAYNVAGPSGYSNTVQVTVSGATLPAAPTGLAVVAVAVGSVALQWGDNAGNETAFEVERSATGATSGFALLAVRGPNVTAYTDTTPAPNTTYWYRVRATNANGPSGYSNTVSATVPDVVVPPTPVETPEPVVLGVLVDWDNDGDFEDAGEDVTDDVLATAPMQSVRGRDQVRALAPPMAGSATATLDNFDRTYSPKNTTGPLYGLLLPGRKVRHTAERPGATPAYAGTVLADAPLAYWRLGETSGTQATDASGNGRHGAYATVASTPPTLNQTGALRGDGDGAVLFDGSDDYVAVTDVSAFNTNTVSVEAWLWLPGQPPSQTASLVNRRRADNVGGYTLELHPVVAGGTTAIRWFCHTTGWQVVQGPALAFRRWYHIVGTYDTATLRLYYDGELVAQATPAAPGNLAQTGPFQFQLAHNIGQTASGGFLKGRLDEVAVYGSVLAADRVRAHYQAGTAGRVSLFTGNLDDLPQQPAFGETTATLPTLGSLARLRGVQATTSLYQNITTDQALHVLLDAAGWPAADRRILPGNTNLLWWWLDDTDAFSAATTLLNTEGPGAYLGEDGEGNIVFEGRYHRLTQSRSVLPQATFLENGAEPYRDANRLDYNPGLKGVINACSAEAVQRGFGPYAVLWQLGQSVTLGAGEEKFFTVRLSDPIYTVSPPVAGTDYTVSSGTLALIEVLPVSRNGGSVTVHVRGGGATGCTITGLQLRGNLLVVTNKVRVEHRVDSSQSQSRYGKRNYTQDVWPEVDPLVAQDFCDAVVNAYQEPRATLSLWLPAYLGGTTADRALYLKPSDRVVVQDAQTGLNGEAMVEQVEYVHNDFNFEVRLGCEEVSSAASNYMIWDISRWDQDRWGY